MLILSGISTPLPHGDVHHLRPRLFPKLNHSLMMDRLFENTLDPVLLYLIEKNEEIAAVFGLDGRELIDNINIAGPGEDIMITKLSGGLVGQTLRTPLFRKVSLFFFTIVTVTLPVPEKIFWLPVIC